MKWNHRVFNIKDRNNGKDLFEVRETYYNKNKVIGSCDLKVMGETLDELKWIAEQIIKSVEQPALKPDKEKHISDIIGDLAESLKYSKLQNGCDLSDIGNEIGLAIGKYIEKDKLGYEIESLIAGIKHGVNLVDGTH